LVQFGIPKTARKAFGSPEMDAQQQTATVNLMAEMKSKLESFKPVSQRTTRQEMENI
jgi:hypothetical protein